jgi:hypothetical protein
VAVIAYFLAGRRVLVGSEHPGGAVAMEREEIWERWVQAETMVDPLQ